MLFLKKEGMHSGVASLPFLFYLNSPERVTGREKGLRRLSTAKANSPLVITASSPLRLTSVLPASEIISSASFTVTGDEASPSGIPTL